SPGSEAAGSGEGGLPRSGKTDEVVLLGGSAHTIVTAGGTTSSVTASPRHLPLKGKAFGAATNSATNQYFTVYYTPPAPPPQGFFSARFCRTGSNIKNYHKVC
ncbi:MAG: hypothetical protein IJ119_14670, partial [Clostridia bacterium]|nr:hypothetical protein [Clostridia bacterium]